MSDLIDSLVMAVICMERMMTTASPFTLKSKNTQPHAVSLYIYVSVADSLTNSAEAQAAVYGHAKRMNALNGAAPPTTTSPPSSTARP